MTTWVYQRSEPGLWTVGYYDPTGRWIPESDQGSADEAAARVRWLNGGRDEARASFGQLRRLGEILRAMEGESSTGRYWAGRIEDAFREPATTTFRADDNFGGLLGGEPVFPDPPHGQPTEADLYAADADAERRAYELQRAGDEEVDEPPPDETRFEVGDRVSWDVGSDTYVGVVESASKARVVVTKNGAPHIRTETFTRRANGRYALEGRKFGWLRHGGEAFRDPSF